MDSVSTFSTPKLNNQNWFLIVILALIFIPQLFMATQFQPDSQGYLTFSNMRPPMLPLLLGLNHLIMGKQFYLFRIFQVGLAVFSMVILESWMRRTFNVSKWLTAFALLLFLIPAFVYEKYGITILSETITYPMFALLLVPMLNFFIHKNVKNAIGFSICTAILILTRNQFYFLYGMMLFGLAWLIYTRTTIKTILKIAGIFLITIIFVSLFNRTYHYLFNNSFSASSGNGAAVLVQPMFFAKASDAAYFKNEKDRAIFTALYNSCHKAGYTLDSQKVLNTNILTSSEIQNNFIQNYNPIFYKCLNPTMAKLGYTNVFEANKIMLPIAVTLIKNNWETNATFYIKKIMYSLGGYYMTSIWLLIGIMACICLLKDRDNKRAIVTLALLLLVLANSVTIASAEMMLNRYLGYSQLALLLVITILISPVFNFIKSNDDER